VGEGAIYVDGVGEGVNVGVYVSMWMCVHVGGWVCGCVGVGGVSVGGDVCGGRMYVGGGGWVCGCTHVGGWVQALECWRTQLCWY